jgi:cyclopropane fatty-acyl-phospholipid synthase-like methyltransferase
MCALQPRHDQKAIWNEVARERDRLVAQRYIPLWERMLDVVGAGPGMRVLDAGCGSGAPARLRRVVVRSSPASTSPIR